MRTVKKLNSVLHDIFKIFIRFFIQLVSNIRVHHVITSGVVVKKGQCFLLDFLFDSEESFRVRKMVEELLHSWVCQSEEMIAIKLNFEVFKGLQKLRVAFVC